MVPDLVTEPTSPPVGGVLPGEGFRIHVHRPLSRGFLTPPQFYEAIVTICGLKHVAPAPHLVEALQVEARGEGVHLEMLMTDGTIGTADVPLDNGIRGFL